MVTSRTPIRRFMNTYACTSLQAHVCTKVMVLNKLICVMMIPSFTIVATPSGKAEIYRSSSYRLIVYSYSEVITVSALIVFQLVAVK